MNDLEESSMTMREVNEPLSGWVSEFEKCDRRQIFWFRFFSAKKGTIKINLKVKFKKLQSVCSMEKYQQFFLLIEHPGKQHFLLIGNINPGLDFLDIESFDVG